MLGIGVLINEIRSSVESKMCQRCHSKCFTQDLIKAILELGDSYEFIGEYSDTTGVTILKLFVFSKFASLCRFVEFRPLNQVTRLNMIKKTSFNRISKQMVCLCSDVRCDSLI